MQNNWTHEGEQAQQERQADAIGARVDEMMADAAKVADYLDDLIGNSQLNSDGNTHFSADISAILQASEFEWGSLAHVWLHRLRKQLRAHMTPFAEQEVIASQDNDGEGDSDAR